MKRETGVIPVRTRRCEREYTDKMPLKFGKVSGAENSSQKTCLSGNTRNLRGLGEVEK